MPVIDEYKFMVKTLYEKVSRLRAVAVEVETKPTSKNKGLIKVMSANMDDWYDSFNDNMQKIAAYNAKQNPRIEEDLEDEFVKFEDAYYHAKAVVQATFPDTDRLSISHANISMAAGPSSPAATIQLPKLQLPEFSGDIRNWNSFADLFSATVHSNPQLSDVQRHMYLRSAVRGEALALISSLPLTGANYIACWDALKSRYENTHLQTNAYLEALFGTPSTSRNPAHIRTLASQLSEYTGALAALGHNVEGWAVPLLFTLSRKLHTTLRENWEKYVVANPSPTLKQFIAFLNEEARVLEAAQTTPHVHQGLIPKNYANSPSERKDRTVRGPTTFMVNTKSETPCCLKCNGQHSLPQCGHFRKQTVADRLQFAKEKRLCLACLAPGHYLKECSRQNTCKHCSAKHHSLLHMGSKLKKELKSQQPIERSTGVSPGASGVALQSTPALEVDSLQTYTSNGNGSVLLATAQADVQDRWGKFQKIRLLIDSASQATFITRDCVKRLGLESRDTAVPVFGMAQTALGVSRKLVCCSFKPEKTVDLQIEALVVGSITDSPSRSFQPGTWEHLRGRPLADPSYYRSQPVDILLGAEWFGFVMLGRPIQGPPGSPILIESIWGYCLLGRLKQANAAIQTFCLTQENPLDMLIRRFWEVEEVPPSISLSPADKECEELYKSRVSRLENGRYIVPLPFRPSAQKLGDSRQAASRRFQLLERRLSQNHALREHYNAFMHDYLDQGHMVLAPPRPTAVELTYFIPHHCIFRGSNSDISKFRVVFDASMPTKDGPSLNQTLYKGPKLQADIVDILTRFRLHEVVLVTDIRQMYRNIMICTDHRDFQRILWRFHPEEPVTEYCLTTVTYGVSTSPFLAIRTLQQLVEEEGDTFPMASTVLRQATYMDDVVTSVSTVQEALELQRELMELLGKGQFQLRKWMSNRVELLRNLPPEHCALSAELLSFEGDAEPSAKILGLVWRPNADIFSYQVGEHSSRITKRTIMSDIAKLFDPIGFICPVIFLGKCLIRYLWQLGIDWDETPPPEVCEKWLRFRQELPALSTFSLPRSVHIDSSVRNELHGFADSSEQGYAGVVYLRSQLSTGEVRLSLMMAKSKVAPLQVNTLPRLELCGLELLSKLLQRMLQIIQPHCHIAAVTAWSDSTVALHWLKSPPHRWKTFVANKVSAAQSRLAPENFRYVPSQLNPADCASRGLLPQDLLQHPMWTFGPAWLLEPPHNWPITKLDGKHVEAATLPEARVVTFAINTALPDEGIQKIMLEKISSLTTLKRIVAWIWRFCNNARYKEHRRKGALTVDELNLALVRCIKWVQLEKFAKDIDELSASHQAPAHLRKLNPFVDDQGILRVGGRLGQSSLPYDRKHPILLPKSHRFVDLIIDYFHRLYLHPGPLNLHSIIQRQFWIISARSVIRHRLAKCVTCFRTRPLPMQPYMGDLPAARLRSIKAFAITGVDYGGPYEITQGKLRKAKVYKAYICLFVCFATKAVHLELASELTTESFLAALRRFIARRGSVKEMHSDCGTNFVGAKRKLEEWTQFLASNEHNREVATQLAEQGIVWSFNPPASPHFGGLWEAGIKSTKQLLSRVLGKQTLTYEEFYTVLVQIEATLNSRPLGPISADPNDLQAITPGHFLLLEPPTTLAEPEPPLGPVTLRERWTLLRQMVHSFWKRWSSDYLCTLQQRNKWNRSSENLAEGTLVVVKDNNLPPLQWRLGRVVKTHPGKDGVVRVAEIKTATGTITRSAVKLCPLPSD